MLPHEVLGSIWEYDSALFHSIFTGLPGDLEAYWAYNSDLAEELEMTHSDPETFQILLDFGFLKVLGLLYSSLILLNDARIAALAICLAQGVSVVHTRKGIRRWSRGAAAFRAGVALAVDVNKLGNDGHEDPDECPKYEQDGLRCP